MRTLLLAVLALPAAWYGYGAWLGSTIPHVEIREIASVAGASDKTLPFFELMSPLPELANADAVPKLEYKKGPPDRFLERITVLFEKDALSPKERIVYYGRRSRTDLYGISALADEPAREAHYVEAALRASQGRAVPDLEGLKGFFYRPLFLREASRLLQGVDAVAIMDQAGTPAFLFEGHEPRAHATALFVRRNAFYRVDYAAGGDHFSLVDPEHLFRRTFLTERRADALEYIARNLSEVRLESSPKSLRETAWAVLLLAADVSVDPSSLDAFFHFAGINALLYRATAASQDIEITDVLRNNVLTSDLYARDIAPEAPKTAEIGRFARLLTRNFDQ
jgi:hypothetical protein